MTIIKQEKSLYTFNLWRYLNYKRYLNLRNLRQFKSAQHINSIFEFKG